MTLDLYRRLLRDIAGFPVEPVRRKLKENVRLLFKLHREELNPDKVKHVTANVLAARRVLAWLRGLPKVRLLKSNNTAFIFARFILGSMIWREHAIFRMLNCHLIWKYSSNGTYVLISTRQLLRALLLRRQVGLF
jgi:Complex 1 protein (LYR family)